MKKSTPVRRDRSQGNGNTPQYIRPIPWNLATGQPEDPRFNEICLTLRQLSELDDRPHVAVDAQYRRRRNRPITLDEVIIKTQDVLPIGARKDLKTTFASATQTIKETTENLTAAQAEITEMMAKVRAGIEEAEKALPGLKDKFPEIQEEIKGLKAASEGLGVLAAKVKKMQAVLNREGKDKDDYQQTMRWERAVIPIGDAPQVDLFRLVRT